MTGQWERWQLAFACQIKQARIAESLKRASLEVDLSSWTVHLTTAVVRACASLGWNAAAKGSRSTRLPQHGKEYLGIDITAFPPGGEQSPLWPMPVAVFELENHRKDARVAYSLWKVVCVRAALRVVFSYRPDWQQGRELVQELGNAVIGSLTTEQRMTLGGETVLVVGNRGEGETFPWGYFKCWRLDANLGRFEKV